MVELTPDMTQWLLLTAAKPLAVVLFAVAVGLLIWLSRSYWKSTTGSESMRIGLPAILLLALAFLLPSLGSTQSLSSEIAKELGSTAKFENVRLLYLETEYSTFLTEPSVSFIGTAEDSAGDIRQFRYTQYETFGLYEMIGFVKPQSSDDSSLPKDLPRG